MTPIATPRRPPAALGAALAGFVLAGVIIATLPAGPPYGIAERLPLRPYLAMPSRAGGEPPRLLSQSGAFADVRTLDPAPGLIPYEVNAALWSDGAGKRRWLALPWGPGVAVDDGRIAFAADGPWRFPAGTVFVKHFAIALDEREPARERRLETRLLVRSADGGVYGVTYRWRADGSDAELLAGAEDEELTVRGADGGVRTQRWHYPSREECLRCHTPNAGHVLGVSTRQLNRVALYPSGVRDQQLRTWSHLGMFAAPPDPRTLAALPRLVALDDARAGNEQRVRSYLDANCAFCHQPGGVGFSNFDARAGIPLAETNLVGGRVVIDHGIDRARNLAPQDPWRSMVLIRMEHDAELRMPPLARNRVDAAAVAAVRAWIGELPGRPGLAPPAIAPAAGRFAHPVRVAFNHPDPLATLRYTLDGSTPDGGSPAYDGPLTLASSTTVRVRAYQDGHVASVVVNATFLIDAR
jgi:uncharacterized repeat protein (TIGR03806 family)